MAKKSKGGFRASVARVWDSAFKSSSPRAHTSPLVSPAAPELLRASSQVPLTASCLRAATSPIPSTSAVIPPATGLATLSLHIPNVLCNPAPATCGTAAWGRFGAALRSLHANSGLFPLLQLVIGNLLSCVEVFEVPMDNQKEYEDLALELQTLSETLSRHLQGTDSSPMMTFIVKTMQSIQTQVNIIANTHNHDSTRRAQGAQEVREPLAACYCYIRALSRQLQIDAGLSVRGIANEQQASQYIQTDRHNNQLEAMKPAKLAAFDSSLAVDVNRRTCTKDTRTAVLLKLSDWSTNPNAPNVCWMNGMAGTGKTTIACTFAETLKARKRLAASFFCTRTTDGCRDVTRIIPTIAYQLARHSAPFRSALCRVLDDDPDVVFSKASTQCDRLLRRPLLEARDEIHGGLVVVIDALDECTATNGVELVLDSLLHAASELPLKLFVASRPEPKIWSKIQSQPEESRSMFVLHDVKHSDVQADIEKYLRDELPSILPAQLKHLVDLSGNLFIYAATAVRYIQAGEVIGEFEECLERMLLVTQGSDAKHAEIDALYMAILKAADSIFLTMEIKARMKLVLWTAVCAREPVSVETLAAIAGISDSKKAMAMLQPLRSVLFVSDNGKIVSTLHASFPDFILDQGRSSAFFCDFKQHNQLITWRCFDILKDELRFNICELESSYLSDTEVPGIQERINRAISPTLAYACRYWADHLQEADASDALYAQLFDFLTERLLFWMEVMNLKQWTGIGIHAILVTMRWSSGNYQSPESSKLIEDIQNFVTSFAGNPISQSTPHLYVSALAFCPRASTVYKHYLRRTRGLIEPEGMDIDNRSAVALASWAVDSEVKSVAYSPDGAYIAVGCSNGSVTIKDAYNGASVFPQLVGHSREINSVVFSPNGTHVVSGSGDHTIRVWNMRDGRLTYPPIKGHTAAVLSVAVSPDNLHIVSGSLDRTIRVWNAQDGTAVTDTPFECHTNRIQSVAFSPTGQCIASGSNYHNLHVWSVQGSTNAGDPFVGHSDSVVAVAFSSDGTRIVSGSYDNTICIWNVQDGALIGTPLNGHTNFVQSVAFSPDGTCIASSSNDHTVRLWDARDGTPVCYPFDGHVGHITSVAFSPDSTRVISGSRDRSVRVWNVQIGPATIAAAQGHSKSVNCIASSIDGTLIVSGSDDCTVRVWNSQDGTLIGTPLQGHTERVSSVALSPASPLIASGSDDCTIRVWDNWNVSLVNILKGHTGAITSVVFSPDGGHIASGSKDCTVRIWNAQHGRLVGAPFEAHTGMVQSVAYSPDGALLVSGSSDNTICVWNLQDASLLTDPYFGHFGTIFAVAFSPDGTLIVSSSADCTIRVWNVRDGAPVGNPFVGHTDYVRSVVFSPDGERIISCSDDCTIRTWNVWDGTLIGAPFEGHTSYIMSLALSPDGRRVFSGSLDCTIRAWRLDSNVGVSDTWIVAKDGWVKSQDSRLLFWVPLDALRILPRPLNLWVIGRYGSITIDYNNLLLGEEWQNCFASRQTLPLC